MEQTEGAYRTRNYLINVVAAIATLLFLAYLIPSQIPVEGARNLPWYTLSTLIRITITLIISIAWAVPSGILAATNRVASVIVTPIVDLLQSIPILGYFPLVIGFLFALGGIGIEISVMVLLFTSMAWAIFFGVVAAVRAIPSNVAEASKSFGLTGWKYTRHVILPGIAPAIVAGSNLAWSDGWFFMIAAEYIQYKSVIVSPPSGGLGLLLAKAAYEYKDVNLSLALLGYTTVLVIVINSLTWHRLMDRGGAGTFKPVATIGLSGIGKLGLFGRSRWIQTRVLHRPRMFTMISQRVRKYSRIEKMVAGLFILMSVLIILYVEFKQIPSISYIAASLQAPPGGELVNLPILIAFTMGRLTLAYLISLGIAILLGVLTAEHKRLASLIYPLYDVGQGVPILALFPVIYLTLSNVTGSARLGLETTCIIMLVLDMIWYMFINITSAVRRIPSEINEVGKLFSLKGLKRVTHLVVPSILPAIVTGSILSWGTGWNTIIFAEYLPSTEPNLEPVFLPGIGALLDRAGYLYGNTVVLVLLLCVISAIVLSMEALVWRRFLRKFERYRVEV